MSDDVDTEMSRIAFGRDGMLYMTIGGPGTGPPESLDRPQHGNDYAGKILRMTDEGGVPPDNPFVGKAGFKPYDLHDGPPARSSGWRQSLHRRDLGRRAGTERRRRGEHPEAGQELRLAVRQLRTRLSRPHLAAPCRDGIERPTSYWVPSIALSGMVFYTGDRFPNWKRNLFVGGMREGEMARTGQLQRIVFNDNWEECGASRCCAICTSASATCGKGPTDCSTC